MTAQALNLLHVCTFGGKFLSLGVIQEQMSQNKSQKMKFTPILCFKFRFLVTDLSVIKDRKLQSANAAKERTVGVKENKQLVWLNW